MTRHISTNGSVLALTAALLATFACGGSQQTTGADLGDCDQIRPGLTSAELDRAAACHAQVVADAVQLIPTAGQRP